MSLLVPSQLVRINHTESNFYNSPDDTSDQRIDIFSTSSEYEGDQIDIGVVNIHGIPKTTAHPKNLNIYENITNYNFDIIGLTETNCYWPSMPEENRWNERIRTWWNKSKASFAYLKHPILPDLHQPGGAMCVALNNTTNSVIQSGSDASMGRWSWMILRGKHDVKTIVLTVYRPCKNSKGYNTVYSQQL